MAKRQNAHVIREELVVLAWHETAHDICTLTMIRSCSANASRLRHREINLARAFSRARRMNRVTVREATTVETMSVRNDTLGYFGIKYTNEETTQTERSPLTVVSRLRISSSTVDPELEDTIWDICVGIHAYTRCPGMNGFKSKCSPDSWSHDIHRVKSGFPIYLTFSHTHTSWIFLHVTEWIVKLKFDLIMPVNFYFVKTYVNNNAIEEERKYSCKIQINSKIIFSFCTFL